MILAIFKPGTFFEAISKLQKVDLEIVGSNTCVPCWHVDIVHVLADLLSIRDLERHFDFEQCVVNGESGYREMNTGDWWKEMEQTVPRYGKLLSIILYTDGISVDFFGHTTMIPVMLTLGNFKVRNQRQLSGKRLLGFVPHLNAGEIRRLTSAHPSLVRRHLLHSTISM